MLSFGGESPACIQGAARVRVGVRTFYGSAVLGAQSCEHTPCSQCPPLQPYREKAVIIRGPREVATNGSLADVATEAMVVNFELGRWVQDITHVPEVLLADSAGVRRRVGPRSGTGPRSRSSISPRWGSSAWLRSGSGTGLRSGCSAASRPGSRTGSRLPAWRARS